MIQYKIFVIRKILNLRNQLLKFLNPFLKNSCLWFMLGFYFLKIPILPGWWTPWFQVFFHLQDLLFQEFQFFFFFRKIFLFVIQFMVQFFQQPFFDQRNVNERIIESRLDDTVQQARVGPEDLEWIIRFQTLLDDPVFLIREVLKHRGWKNLLSGCKVFSVFWNAFLDAIPIFFKKAF